MPESFPKPETKKNPRERLAQEIRIILKEKHFSINPRLNEYFAHEVENTDRFISIPGHYAEQEQRKEGFLKIPVDREFDEFFQRQVELTQFLSEDGHVKIRGVVSANTDRRQGIPYAIFETFEDSDARIGYIGSYEGGELLGEREAQGTMKTLEALHAVNLERMPTHLRGTLKEFPNTYEEFKDEIMEVVDQSVKPLDAPKGKRKEPFHELLGRRFGLVNYRSEVEDLLERWKEVIRAEEAGKPLLVHGDLGPGNMYVAENGEIEPVDYEQAGISTNEILGTVVDYGNFRARAWNNLEFREALDNAILAYYRNQNREEVGKAIISLGILRSHMILSGFFESYPLPKQREAEQAKRRESTENDIIKSWEVAGLTPGKQRRKS